MAAVIQDEQGCPCDCAAAAGLRIEPGGAIRLRRASCAIYDVAREHPEACAAELELFGEILGAEVVRDSDIVAGDRTCTHRVEARPA